MSAILLGLEGCQPETITTEHSETPLTETQRPVTRIGGVIPVPLTERDIDLHPDTANASQRNDTTAASPHGRVLATETIFGGRRAYRHGTDQRQQRPTSMLSCLPYAAQELLDTVTASTSIAAARATKHVAAPRMTVRAALLHLRDVMVECEQRRSLAKFGGLRCAGERRCRRPLERRRPHCRPEFAEDWVNLVALETRRTPRWARRHRPTNGAAGIVPAVLHYVTTTRRPAGTLTMSPCDSCSPLSHRTLFKERASTEPRSAVRVRSLRGRHAAAGLAETRRHTATSGKRRRDAMNTASASTCDPSPAGADPLHRTRRDFRRQGHQRRRRRRHPSRHPTRSSTLRHRRDMHNQVQGNPVMGLSTSQSTSSSVDQPLPLSPAHLTG